MLGRLLEHLAHRKVGSCPDLVFIHGWPLHGETWRAVVPHLANRFTCHVFDLAGTGKSTWDASTTITLLAHADRIVAAIEALGLSRLGLVAHDSGGGIARLVAARLGARCFGAVLGNTEIPGHHPPGLVAFLKLAKLGAGGMLPWMLRSKLLRHSNLGFGGCFQNKWRPRHRAIPSHREVDRQRCAAELIRHLAIYQLRERVCDR